MMLNLSGLGFTSGWSFSTCPKLKGKVYQQGNGTQLYTTPEGAAEALVIMQRFDPRARLISESADVSLMPGPDQHHIVFPNGTTVDAYQVLLQTYADDAECSRSSMAYGLEDMLRQALASTDCDMGTYMRYYIPYWKGHSRITPEDSVQATQFYLAYSQQGPEVASQFVPPGGPCSNWGAPVPGAQPSVTAAQLATATVVEPTQAMTVQGRTVHGSPVSAQSPPLADTGPQIFRALAPSTATAQITSAPPTPLSPSAVPAVVTNATLPTAPTAAAGMSTSTLLLITAAVVGGLFLFKGGK